MNRNPDVPADEIKIPVPISLLESAKKTLIGNHSVIGWQRQRLDELAKELSTYLYMRKVVEAFTHNTYGTVSQTDDGKIPADAVQIGKLISDYFTKPPEPPIPATAASIFDDANNGAVNNGNGDQLFPTKSAGIAGGDTGTSSSSEENLTP